MEGKCCGGLGFTPTLRVPCPAPHKPTLQYKGPILGAGILLKGFPSAPGQEGYLAEFAMGTEKAFTSPEEVEVEHLMSSISHTKSQV